MLTIIGLLIFFKGVGFYLKVYYQDLLNNEKEGGVIRFLNIMTPFFQ